MGGVKVTRSLRVAAAAGLLLAVVSCGPPSDTKENEPASETDTTSAEHATGDQSPKPQSKDATADLSEVSCAQRRNGDWRFTALLTNPGKQAASYVVTVAVVGADDVDVEARRLTLSDVEPNLATAVEVDDIVGASGSDGTCTYQVQQANG